MPRCYTCDKPIATPEDFKTIPGGEGEHLCWSEYSKYGCEPIDWRARALKAESFYAVFLGPCFHGRDPFDRCDEDDDPEFGGCGELGPREALIRTVALRQRETCAKLAESHQLTELAAAIRKMPLAGLMSPEELAERMKAAEAERPDYDE